MNVLELPLGTLLIDKEYGGVFLLCLKQDKKITWLSSGLVTVADYGGEDEHIMILKDEDYEVFYPESTQ